MRAIVARCPFVSPSSPDRAAGQKSDLYNYSQVICLDHEGYQVLLDLLCKADRIFSVEFGRKSSRHALASRSRAVCG